MKVLWEPSDWIEDNKPVGQIVTNTKRGEHYLLGYTVPRGPDNERWTMVSLRDGMILGPWSPDQIAGYLNAHDYQPVHVRMTVETRLLG